MARPNNNRVARNKIEYGFSADFKRKSKIDGMNIIEDGLFVEFDN